MGATLTYFGRPSEPRVTFVLDSPTTVVGRRPREVDGLPEVAAKVKKRETFCVRLGDTLFIGIPSDPLLARNHFVIRRGADESSGAVYLIQDLGNLGGFKLNDARSQSGAEMSLRGGDRIRCGGGFSFGLE